ncbi:CpaF family protein [Effusibacillus consociatus]|uniref:CpaF family protein n=1 Tax=Effusibacillus consociatus TaxID=1117041 RepID=A0ABV9PYZ9_9BACL
MRFQGWNRRPEWATTVPVQTAAPSEQLETILRDVYRELRPHHFQQGEEGRPTQALSKLILNTIESCYPQWTREKKEHLLQETLQEMTGYGPLEPLFHEEGVSDIQVIGPSLIHFTQNGKRWRFEQRRFRDEEHCRRFVHRLAIQSGRSFDEATHEVDLDLTDGSRLHALKTASGTIITIRRPSRFLTIDELCRMGILTDEIIEFLHAVQKRRLSWVIAGNTGSLKTTLIQHFLSRPFLPPHRIVGIMEEKRELRPDHPYVISMEEVLPGPNGEGYKLRQYVRAAMRMYLDVLVIGELRGPEALDALRAANTGHQVITSVHAGSPQQALSALKMLSLSAGEVPAAVVDDLMAEGIRILIQMERAEGKQGYQIYLKSICEVTRTDQEIVPRPIFEFVQTGIGNHGVPVGKLTFKGISPSLASEFQAWGIQVPLKGGATA